MVLVGLPLALQTDASKATGWFNAPVAGRLYFPLIRIVCFELHLSNYNVCDAQQASFDQTCTDVGIDCGGSALGGRQGFYHHRECLRALWRILCVLSFTGSNHLDPDRHFLLQENDR